ncbi:hypothetical protein FRC17_002579 [Serendipita sp. 399]|nr:hypothetical protein FRC17_002579 [Serendipita sp. 399]
MSNSEKLNTLPRNPLLRDSLTKLENFLNESEKRQCKYAWADTVCIDKSSSAELDESIRSMFAWYRDSHICIVHLSRTHNSVDMERDPWFTRGWTLQELLAPRNFAFYSSDWTQITTRDSKKYATGQGGEWVRLGSGARPGEQSSRVQPVASQESLWPTIAKITGIDIDDLLNFKPGLYDIGKRMAWASKRETTRTEDTAYCLIGIFDVNLSIAYGEKEKAFYRLQVEILQSSDDKTLFDWQGDASTYNSMLAASPACFSMRFDLRAVELPKVARDPAFTLTSVGIRALLVVHQMDEYAVHQSWKLPGATAFFLLGISSEGRRVIMILEKLGTVEFQYKRLGLVEEGLSTLSLSVHAKHFGN